jgi:hypothetical protein
MVCKADTRCILVRAKRPYFQCSLLLALLCTKVLVVGGYKLVERGIALRSLCVGVFECLSVCLVHCHCVVLAYSSLLVEGTSLPFYSMQREGSGYNIWMYKNRKKNALRCSLFIAFLSVHAFA